MSERALRISAGVGAAIGLIALAGIGSAVVTVRDLVTPRSASAQSTGTTELDAVAARVASLRDTIAVIRQRESQIRLLAGLPATDSTGRDSLRALAGDVVISEPRSGTGAMREDVDSLIEHAELLSSRFAAVTDSLSQNAQRMASMPSIMPTAGWLTSHFSRNRKHPILHVTRPHEGIDVSAPMGAPIVAPASGVVKSTGRESGYGLTVEVDHGNGIVTRYAHCSRILVRAGQRVTRGQTIAAVGNTGLSTGPHLHYEIHVNGKVVDPLTYVLADAIPD